LRDLYKVIINYKNLKENHIKLNKEYEKIEQIYKHDKKSFEAMDEIYKKEQAGILAAILKENKPCPVCGSKNHPNPAVISKNLVVPTKEELKIAKEKSEKSEKEYNLIINELTKLNTDCKNYFDIVSNSLLKFSKPLNIDEKYSDNTDEIVKLKGLELKVNIDNLNKDLIKINEKLSLKKSIEEKNQTIENSIIEIEKELSTLEKTEKILLPEIAQINTRIEEYKKEIPNDILDIKTLENLINIKSKELDDSQKKLIKLREDNENISRKLEGETSKSNQIKDYIEELKTNVEKIRLEFNNVLKSLEFDDFSSYAEFKSKIYLIEDLEKEVEDYYLNLNLLKSKKEDIVIKTKDLSFIDIDSIDEKLKKLQEEKKGLELRLRELYSVLENNKSILKNVESLNAKFKVIEEEYKVVGELADLANGKKSPYISFERYILASYFEDIIEAANIRLEKMTGDRFSLIRKKSKSKGAGQKGLELEIYDNYTDSSRDVSSLSGGESFKASLSLALGLSDVVQSNAGGVSLDTMFVDEGFGTLDPQSLDNAIDSLLELQRGGRLVGIISHVEELKERIDAKLEVVSTAKGSKAEFNIL
ncbi:SbcC/MukB-like Walker B domain-containing protein, partial [Paraclostridium bifermentans]|uniref:SbcC/MukB-like Walker B domain-containing protein n=1 Tax=Paraclostridium bifermentans TaxID=1490 RepID=UPI002432BFB2